MPARYRRGLRLVSEGTSKTPRCGLRPDDHRYRATPRRSLCSRGRASSSPIGKVRTAREPRASDRHPLGLGPVGRGTGQNGTRGGQGTTHPCDGRRPAPSPRFRASSTSLAPLRCALPAASRRDGALRAPRATREAREKAFLRPAAVGQAKPSTSGCSDGPPGVSRQTAPNRSRTSALLWPRIGGERDTRDPSRIRAARHLVQRADGPSPGHFPFAGWEASFGRRAIPNDPPPRHPEAINRPRERGHRRLDRRSRISASRLLAKIAPPHAGALQRIGGFGVGAAGHERRFGEARRANRRASCFMIARSVASPKRRASRRRPPRYRARALFSPSAGKGLSFVSSTGAPL